MKKSTQRKLKRLGKKFDLYRKAMKALKGCLWYKGRDGMPDLTKCKECVYTLTCIGRKFMRGK